MFDIDRTMKLLADRFAPDYIHWLMGPSAQPVEKLKVELPATTRYADLVYRLVDEKTATPFIFHLGFQAQRSEKPMGLRMLEYHTRLLERYRQPVCSTVVYLVKEADIGDEGMLRSQCPAGKEALVFRYDVVRLWEVECNTLIEEGLWGLYPLLGLTRLAEPPGKALRAIVKDINQIEEPLLRQDMLFGFKTLSALVHPKELLNALIRKEAIMESPVLKEIYEEALAEGWSEGQAEGRRAAILDILLTRFRLSHQMVKQFEARLGQIESLPVLQKLTADVTRAESPDEVLAVLDQLGVEASEA